MAYFNFNRLIKKYTNSFTVIKSVGEYDDYGDWNITTTETPQQGAIIGISENKIYRSDGVLTAKDKQLFMTESLGDITETFVLYKGNKYKVEQETSAGNEQFTGVFSYVLKWVSAFEGGDTV